MGIPRTWETSPPKQGELTCRYAASPEYAELEFRLQLASRYALWNVSDPLAKDIAKIEWWMCLTDTPDYFIEMALLLIQKFTSVSAAFKHLDVFRERIITRQVFRVGWFRVVGWLVQGLGSRARDMREYA